MANPFLDYLSNHPGADAAALKELFRILAKRTHPDLGAGDDASFVHLQEAYREAVEGLLRAEPPDGPSDDREPRRTGFWTPTTAREAVLHNLYRYKAHLPAAGLDRRPLPGLCMQAFALARERARGYTPICLSALDAFHEQFHLRRAVVARYPDVLTKYRCLIQGLASFYDYLSFPTALNERLTRSYLSEIRPVTDFDPTASPDLRTNRSATARAALSTMRRWIEDELGRPPCRIV